MDNLIDFDLPSEATAPPSGGANLFSSEPLVPEPAKPMLPEPMAPSKHHHHPPHHHHHPPHHHPHRHHGGEEGGGDESDATESADSENDMDPASSQWESRRSSSSSNHSVDGAEGKEMRQFMKAYVEKVFHGKEDFEQEEPAHFGELCSGENSKGREWFAKYVSAQRCHNKCVSETTFYRLVQSFAVVLFECYQMDDYTPAKHLMTMCFTYYHVGKSLLSPAELLERGPPPPSYLNKANSWLSGKKDAAERLLKTSSVAKTDVKGFLGGLESKLRGTAAMATRKNEEAESPVDAKPKSPVSPEAVPENKVYLYTHLKQQPIWHTLRFWNAAFFDAVHCERNKRSPTTREKWCHMTQEEKEDSSRCDENITFGQLGTFTHNMLAFGLSKKLCNDFLKKQATIGNLNEEQYKMLSDHIEKMATE
ncbi:uncharacterized protein KIAA0513 homolog isoform 2-T2 [Aplochiton taeniatus]